MRHLITSIFGRRSERATAERTPFPRHKAQLCVEALEDRQVPAVALNPTGVLLIDGSSQNDWAWVSPVAQNGKSYYRAFGNLGGTPTDMWFDAAKVTALQFRGFAGSDDFSHTTALRCWMYGGEGNDRLVGGYGPDVIYGEGGNDSISDQTQRATANWDNWLFGGAGDDYILGAEGNDQIAGGDGNDRLFGAGGIDYMWGEAGNDEMQGGWGNDVLYGGSGDDFLSGFQGDDWLAGGAGRDTIYGDAGKDRIHYDPLDIRDFSTSDGDQWWV